MRPTARRPRKNCLALNLFHIHARIIPDQAKNKKPTVGFQASFFVMGPISANSLNSTASVNSNHEKMEKHDRKMSFFLGGGPRFLPNRLIFGSFLAVKLLSVLQWVVHKALAGHETAAIFQKHDQSPPKTG
jgi:hypothetical protein